MEEVTFYHIYNHANGHENLFRTNDNYTYFLKRLVHFINPVADTYAYCLMPNHFHILIKTKELVQTSKVSKTVDVLDKNNLYSKNPYSKAFADLCNSYTKAYNNKYNRKGNLFNHKFKRKSVENDEYLIKLIQYIHANPVHHGFVKSIEDWSYSSYNTIISNKSTLLKRDEVLEWFDGKEGFIDYHNQPIDIKIDFENDW